MASTTKESAEKGFVKLTLAKSIRNIQNMALFYHSTINIYVCTLVRGAVKIQVLHFPFSNHICGNNNLWSITGRELLKMMIVFREYKRKKLINK